MKKLLVLFCAVIGAISTSFAQVSLGGGVHSNLAFTSFPKPMNEFYGSGFGGGAHGDLNIIPPLTLRLSFDYNTFRSDKMKLKQGWLVFDQNGNLTNDFTVEGLDVSIIGVTANLVGKLSTHSVIRPYGIVGLGLQITSMSDERVVFNGQDLAELRAPAGSTDLGANIGVGAELGLGQRTSLFFEAKYTLIFASGATSSYIPMTLGVTF